MFKCVKIKQVIFEPFEKIFNGGEEKKVCQAGNNPD